MTVTWQPHGSLDRAYKKKKKKETKTNGVIIFIGAVGIGIIAFFRYAVGSN